jgi:hypothetical protein
MVLKHLTFSALILLATAALAHEFWLQPASFRVAVGAAVPLRLLVNQTCVYTDLSKSLIFKMQVRRIKRPNAFSDSCIVRVTVLGKVSQKPITTITCAANHLFSDVYTQCSAVRSYSTGKNKDAIVQDYDYGDLIVADFNFDGKDDFAVKNDSGGNGGPLYNFYIQHSTDRFVLSRYLTDTVCHFPSRFESKHKTFVVLTHADAMAEGETTYRLNPKTGSWREIKYRRILCCD